ncbi:3-oxoacyl-[acyl-carrier protein] reductase [Kineococcus xinjiangensis]|uniref:3-oxoacyl-[acyl-carrier protein] reductase n=1 Tax=Kineococcus xinjiangensis TaxID=512762 RepID=A0A2S6IDN2_9ACTN|nr:SDR family NAD(P)-dependent oxidoreductase [Kineococcus xinjiangensis]PPK92307.1 3-oxoacyl-[acyl-carrier protein] reductase [Kineococcus xinjiangensis]
MNYSVSRAVVTGGARGLGAAVAERLARDGLSVALLDVNEEAARETAASIAQSTGSTVVGLRCDVTDRAQVTEALSHAADALGGLDTLIGNAGITRDRMFHKLSDDDWDQVLAVNLTGVFDCLRAAAPWLRTEGPGRVVLISSIVAKTGNLGQMNYIAAKAGVVGLVRSAAVELARFGTTVNGIRPGFIETPMTAAMPQEARDRLMTDNLLGRAGQPEDIAGGVAFLCSDDAAFVTGQLLDINGGAAL